MRKLRSFLLILVCSLVVLLQPCYVYGEQSYIITETELAQLEKNNEQQKKALEKLKTELQAMSKSYQKSEREKELICKFGIPTVCVGITLAFVGGFVIGYKTSR